MAQRQEKRLRPNRRAHKAEEKPFSEHEVEDIEDRSRLRVPLIYEVVRREGEEEMARPAVSLMWSGIAAGLSISFSLIAQAVLTLHLPDAPWRPLVTSLGYPVGFLIVVLGRQQLFTENTITAVLPFAAEPTLANMRRLVRMWIIVFLANIGRHAAGRAVLHHHAHALAGTRRGDDGDQPAGDHGRLGNHVLQGDCRRVLDRRDGVVDPECRVPRSSK